MVQHFVNQKMEILRNHWSYGAFAANELQFHKR